MNQSSKGSPLSPINGEDRPSSARRRGLREADAGSSNVPLVSNFFPIERYYEASEKVRTEKKRR